MKTKKLFLMAALIAGLGLIPAGRVTAQTFTILHSFAGSFGGLSDGASPYAGLVANSSGNTLYGTTRDGGDSGFGKVFAVNTNGTGFTILHTFTFGSDGGSPYAKLILSDNTLYGTAFEGGSSLYGSVFKVNTDGTGFTTLHSFTATSSGTNSGGAKPIAGLVLSGNTLYGTAYFGGSSGNGTVFAVHTDGTSFTNLHSFNGGSDGANPYAGLILSGHTLYGTAIGGGSSGCGTVFAVNTNGTGFKNLHSFTYSSDGCGPYAGLVLSGNTLYGTAYAFGSSGAGTVFAVNTNGTGFTNLHSFNGGSDGANPYAGLILSGHTLYGTAEGGGSSGWGTVFAVETNGTGFTTLHSFTNGSGGGTPEAGLILLGNTLYGTANVGGSSSYGTIFSLSLPPPQLTIIRSAANVILRWPTNAAGFTLQSTTNLVSPAVWSTNSPGPVVADGQNTVTNPVSGTQKFFRLSQ